MKECIKVGLLGAGTVGSGVLTVLEENTAEIEKKVGVPIHVSKILVRDMKKAKELSEKYQLTDKIEDIVEDPEIDIVVELIGREHPAKEYIAAALEHKKNVVTANKDVLAKYGKELFPLAEENKVDFMFEASVGGGIPIIRPLKSCLAANKVTSVMGIVNGTTNYMLTKMSQENMDYADVLREAQEKGYAESDPTADVGGLDEIVDHGVNGMKSYAGNPNSIADSVLTVLYDKQLATNMAKKAKQKVKEEFNWTKIAQDTHYIYEKAICKTVAEKQKQEIAQENAKKAKKAGNTETEITNLLSFQKKHAYA